MAEETNPPGGHQTNVLPVPEGDFFKRLNADGGGEDDTSTVPGCGTGHASLGSSLLSLDLGGAAGMAKRLHAAFVRESLVAGGPDKYLQKKYDTPEKKWSLLVSW